MPPATAVEDPEAGELDEESGLTEITKLQVTTQHGVGAPANGTEFLLFKGLAAKDTPGDPDDPDAAPGGAGCGCCAACKCNPSSPDGGTQCGCCDQCKCPPVKVGAPPAAAMMTKEALDAVGAAEEADLEDVLGAELAKASRKFPAATRRKYAGQGKALPDGSYPVPDADAARRAAILIRAKKGKWKAAARLLVRLGYPNPLQKKPKVAKAGGQMGTASATQYPGDAGGAAAAAMVAPGPTAGATTPPKPRKKKKRNQGGDNGTGSQTQVALKDAVAYAPDELEAMIAKGAAEAVSKALARFPAPGGPVTAVPRSATATADAREELVSKAARYRDLADAVADSEQARNYRDLAREADEAAAKLAVPAG